MKSGDSVDIHEYRFTFRDVKEVTSPNSRGGGDYRRNAGDRKPETVLYAKTLYNTARSMMTQAAIDGGITRDLYAALGEELENGAWRCRIFSTNHLFAGFGRAGS